MEKNQTNVTPILKGYEGPKELQACQPHLDLWKDDEAANSGNHFQAHETQKNLKEWSATGFPVTLQISKTDLGTWIYLEEKTERNFLIFQGKWEKLDL